MNPKSGNPVPAGQMMKVVVSGKLYSYTHGATCVRIILEFWTQVLQCISTRSSATKQGNCHRLKAETMCALKRLAYDSQPAPCNVVSRA